MRDCKPSELIKCLKKFGFEQKVGGKHIKMVNPKNGISVGIGFHNYVKRNTLDAIRKQCQIDKKEFYANL